MPIEKPAHIHPTRMRHISDADLFAALDLTLPALAAVRAAVEAKDWPAAYTAWAAYFAQRAALVSVVNVERYAALPAPLREGRGQPVIEAAHKLRTEQMDYLGQYHQVAARYGYHYFYWMVPLLNAYALDGDVEHIATFVRLFNEWYELRDQVVGTIPDLDVIWYTLGLGIRTRVFLDHYAAFRASPLLDGPTHARLLKSFLGALRWLAEEHSHFRYGNWQIHGVATLYELGVFFPEFHEAAGWRAQGWTRLIEHLDLDVYADGGHSERAPSYHAHVLDVYNRVAAVAELNDQPRLQAHPRFAGMYQWLFDHLNPLGASTNFNDSHVIWVGHWAVPGAVLLDDPRLKGLAEHFGSADEIAWTLAGLPDRAGGVAAADTYARLPSQPPSAGSVLQPISKFALLRDGLAPHDLFMAVNYGPLIGHEYESHSHLDALAFVASGRGAHLALEAGLALLHYDEPIYKNWLRTAQAHSMVVVNGADPDEAAKEAVLRQWSSSPLLDVFDAAHAGYAAQGVAQHRRVIVFVKGAYWLIYDALEGTGAPHLDWRIFTPQPLAPVDGRYQPSEWPGLVVSPILPADGQIQTISGFGLEPGPRAYEGTITRRELPVLSHTQRSAAPLAEYLHLLYPAREAAEAAQVRAERLPLTAGAGVAARLITPAGDDRLAIGAGGEVALPGWHTDAGLAWLRSADCWAVCGATHLNHAGTALLTSSTTLTAAHLWPTAAGVEAHIETDRRADITLRLPFAVSAVHLQGAALPHESTTSAVSILLPGPGTYHLRLTRQHD